MWIICESQYPGLRLRHTQICVVLALCWNVVLACFGTFPVLFPLTEEAFEPMFGQQVYQLSYARLCKTLQDFARLCKTLQDFARLCKTLQDIQVESLGQERNQSSSQAPPPIETQVEAPGDAPRRPQMVPLAPVTTCKNSRLNQSLKTCTYNIYIYYVNNILNIYIYMSNIFQSEVSTKRIRQCWRQESNELFEHMPHLESPWAKGGRPCRPVGQGQVRSSQVKSGQVRSSQVKSGQVRSSQVKSGTGKPSGKPLGKRPGKPKAFHVISVCWGQGLGSELEHALASLGVLTTLTTQVNLLDCHSLILTVQIAPVGQMDVLDKTDYVE